MYNVFNKTVSHNWFSMLLFTNIISQGNYTEEISGRPDMTFLFKQNRNSNRFEISYQSILTLGLMQRPR